jgi:hypothetical protein
MYDNKSITYINKKYKLTMDNKYAYEIHDSTNIDFNISGWIPLCNNYIVYEGDSGYGKCLKKYVTDAKEIKILMDERFNLYDQDMSEEYGYKEIVRDMNVVIKSDEGFVVGDIINAIFNFLVEKLKKEDRSNLALTGFKFSAAKLEVYPNTDS